MSFIGLQCLLINAIYVWIYVVTFLGLLFPVYLQQLLPVCWTDGQEFEP